MALLSGLWALVLFVSPVPEQLAADMEKPFPPFSLEQHALDNGSRHRHPVHLVVLGAGTEIDPDLHYSQQLSGVMPRLIEAVRIHHLIPRAQLVASATSGDSLLSQAEVVARAGLELGFEPTDTLMMPLAVNTETEARAYARRFGEDSATVILCTAALHMQRALFWFRYYGLDPIPAPTAYQIRVNPRDLESFWGFSTCDKPALLDQVIHEQVGLWYARWKTERD